MPYNHTAIESKWIKNWSESNIYKTPSPHPTSPKGEELKKKYILEAFPYPSGDGLHVGHALPMTAGDITSRFYRMNGYSVLHPMGWDSFGLPTENFAKKKGLHPQDVTDNAIANFTKQIHRLGVDYDWSKELATSDPSYYKWTQWFFQLLYKRGLAYKKEALVNWDPVDMTVLANEQVLADGTAERSGAKVEQKMMSQWFFKITDYAERLLNDLDGLDWPESTKLMQKNWIGKSVGAEVEFDIWQDEVTLLSKGVKDEVFGGINESHPLVKEGQNGSFGEIPYIPYNKDLLDNSRTLRAEPTKYEELVWRNILKSEKTSYKFNRQKPLLNYIVDFYCSELKLVIEIDGESHGHQIDYDQKRTDELGVYGIKVLRFTNEDVNTNLNGVKVAIEEFIKEKSNGIPPKSEILTPFVKGVNAPKIKIFTTRVDTIFGVTYLVLAPEHHLVDNLTTPEQFEAVAEYKEKSKQKSQFERTEMNKDKTGVFTGSYCINPFNGAKVPVWVGDYVLASYGTGAVMAVPAHDERDYEFARKYDLEIIQSIAPKDNKEVKGCFTEYGILVNSGEFTGLTTEEAKVKMAEFAETKGFGNAKVTYRLRDWSIGRQRYWGCPIPVVYGTSPQPSPIVSPHPNPLPKVEGAETSTEFDLVEIKNSKELIEKARELRKNQTEAEVILWEVLRNRQFLDLKFRRQQPFQKYIADFYCHDLKLVIELDGGIHENQKEYDEMRTRELSGTGIQVIRFKNEEVYSDLASIFNAIKDIRHTIIAPSPVGEGWGEVHSVQEMLVPESDLPVLLPQDLDLSTGMIKPLRSNFDFINSGSKYGEGWTREGDTMDTFVCSSWYFFRYCSGNIDNAFANPEDMKQWMPVDQYIIGAEHSTMHLLYARFFTKVLFDAGYIDFQEPFAKMRHQGLILGPDNQKMSKSKGNVINPNEVFDEYGADTLRMYEMFMGQFDQPKPWSTSSIKGVRRFLDRVWNMQELVTTNENYEGGMKVEVALHKLVKKIGEDIESYRFNTCVSEFMMFANLVEEVKGIHNVQYGWFLRVLSPFAPFITEEIWSNGEYSENPSPHPNPLPKVEGVTSPQLSRMGEGASFNSIHLQPWPQYYPEFLVEDTVTIGVQINGKVRGEITLSPNETEENAMKIVMELDIVKRNLDGKVVRKFVYVPGRIVNVVVG